MSPVTVSQTGLRSRWTEFFGHRNLVSVERRCDGCGKLVELSAYDAREWVALGPLPLFPLAAYRVFDSCPNCLRSRRLRREDYDAWVAEEVAPATAALAASPDALDCRLALAWQYYGLGRFEHALAVASIGLLAAPPRPEVQHAAGVALMGLGRLQEAAELLSLAVSAKPDDALLRYDLGRCLMQRRSSQALAEHHLADGHRLAPDHLGLAVALALVRCRRGEWRTAHHTWQACARLSPDGAWRTRHAALIARAELYADDDAR